jgi:protein-disulfide isomerase
VLLAVGGAVVLVVIGVVLAVSLTGGGPKSTTNVPSRGSLVNALPGAATVHQLLKGIPQHANALGSPNAPATMVEYVDLQCPYCRQFELDVMPSLVSDYVRPGKLRVELRPVAFIGPDSVRGRKAAVAAGDQNALFNFTQLLYLNQGTENTGWLDDNMVTAAAASIPGLDVPKLLTDLNSAQTAAKAAAFDVQATVQRVNSTPTILVGKTSGKPAVVQLSSPSDKAAVVAAIQKALQ